MEEGIYKDAKIVVIDDVVEVLNSTKNCLEFEGMQVKCFNNPIEGLEYLKTNKADVLLLDFFMPEMNGDDFIKELRNYNNETIVILQTGYSDKIPPLEMIDKMNIQGYLDKMKGEDKLVLMTKAAVKTSYLNKAVREKDKEIARLSFKKAIVGDLITHLVNESKDQIFQIAGMTEVIKSDTEDYNRELEVINNAINKINELYNALNFESQVTMDVKQLVETLKILLKAKMMLDNIKLNIENDNGNITIKYSDEVIYILLKIIDVFSKNNIKEINIRVCKDMEETYFLIANAKYVFENEKIDLFINKLKVNLEYQEDDKVILKII